MIWLVVAFAAYPCLLVWFSRWLARREREGIQHDERGFPRPKSSGLPFGFLVFGYPLILSEVAGVALKGDGAGRGAEAAFVFAAAFFLVGHWFIIERLAAGIEAAEELEAKRQKAKEQ